MLSLKPNNVTPPDKYTWKFPQDGWVAAAFDKDDWFRQIDKHYKDNDYIQPDNWKEIAENDLCRRLSGEWCSGGDEYSFIDTRFTLQDFINGTKVLTSLLLHGEVVSAKIAEERALICSRCPLNVPVPGCRTCSAIANVIGDFQGKGTTKYDYLLKACGVCKCANEVAVWVPARDLAKGVDEKSMKKYRKVEECWKWKEIDEL